MSAPVQEGELTFTFPPSALRVLKFDAPASHQVNGMKAVDFVVEFRDYDLFVEVKDAEKSTADATSRNKFLAKLQSGRLETNLIYKYRDSLTYRWCEGRSASPVWYVVLLELATLQPRDYQLWTDTLKRRLPLQGPPNWTRALVSKVWVLNTAEWNKLSVFGSVRRG